MTRYELRMFIDRLSYAALIALALALLLAGCDGLPCSQAEIAEARKSVPINYVAMAPGVGGLCINCERPDPLVLVNEKARDGQRRFFERHELCHVVAGRKTGNAQFHAER